jgi:hypothetical protein
MHYFLLHEGSHGIFGRSEALLAQFSSKFHFYCLSPCFGVKCHHAAVATNQHEDVIEHVVLEFVMNRDL